MEDGRASILIVDDNVSLRKTLSFVLGRKGYTVTTAEDGPGAIELVRKCSFDVIFMDIKMPLMNGVETYKRIKQIRPDAVVIMMTAYAVEDLVQEALHEGVYGIVYKPLDMKKVLDLIEGLRDSREGAFILVVDDDPAMCQTFRNVLNRKGYEVGVAHTGEEAIERACDPGCGVIFVDVKLPTINGLETYLAIQKVNSGAVVVMMTGHRQEVADLVNVALSNGAYACLYKPLEMEKVLVLVEEILDRRHGGGWGIPDGGAGSGPSPLVL